MALGTVFQPTAGAVDLGFANNHSLSPEIWRNAHPERAAAGVSVWFAGLGDSSVLFGLNDRGPDQDWDDFVGRMDLAAVPVPGAVWLLGTALVCLAASRRRDATPVDPTTRCVLAQPVTESRGPGGSSSIMPEGRELTRPVMRRGARLHADQTGRQPGEEACHLGAPQRLAQHHLARPVHGVHLEHLLGQIKSDRANPIHGWLPLLAT